MSGALYLEPHVSPRVRSLMGSPGLLHALADALGSPLGVVLPEQIDENVERFRSVYRKHHLSGRIFLAHKANRSSALLRRLVTTGAGVDVASLGELQHALGCGFGPQRIMATGPKSPEFLWLAARTGATVSLDSAAELDQLAALVGAHGLPRVPVLLRLSGFEATGAKVLTRRSRFGSPVRELDAVLTSVERHGEAVELTGVAYHLDTTSSAEKAVALEGCLMALEESRTRGLAPRMVDVGGGFGVNYLADPSQWERYTTELAGAALGSRPRMAWGGYGYGLRNEGGTLRGTLGLYPAYRPVAGERYLDELLSRPAVGFGGRTLAALLLEHLYDLCAEPGRALLDQCGLTLARVVETRDTGAGPPWVRLAATSGDIGLEEHGILMDPVLLPRDPGVPGGTDPVAVHLFGSLCLESDLITRRIVHLPWRPAPGDLMAFVNTAGYCMDFHATHAQDHPIARKVAVWQDGGDAWRWCLDDQYWPITPPGGHQ